MSELARSEISSVLLYVVSVAEDAGLSLTSSKSQIKILSLRGPHIVQTDLG